MQDDLFAAILLMGTAVISQAQETEENT